MVATGAADASCVLSTTPRTWSSFGSRQLLSTHRQARMAVQFNHNGTPSASLALWMFIVPNETMRCPLFLVFFFFFFFISLIADGPRHYHPAYGHKGSSHLSPVEIVGCASIHAPIKRSHRNQMVASSVNSPSHSAMITPAAPLPISATMRSQTLLITSFTTAKACLSPTPRSLCR